VTNIQNSKSCDDHYKEILEVDHPMRPEILAHLQNGQHNEDDADVCASRQQKKLRIVYDVLPEQQ
jgi:hypothetical protein